MKYLMLLLASVGCISTAYVQHRDEFSGGLNPTLRWNWLFPNNTPPCTLDAPTVSFSSDALQIGVNPGALYSIYNFQKNLPNLIVQGSAPDDWYLETRFRIDWSTVPLNHYVQAGIVIGTDADNYFQVYISREVSSGDVVGSTALEDNTSFVWGGAATGLLSPNPSDEWLGLRVRHLPADESAPARIELSYWKESVGEWQPFWHAPGPLFYPAGSDQYNFIQNLISQAGSVRVGLYTATSDSEPTQLNIFEFDYFETNLPIQTRASLGDVNGDCVVDDADLLAVLFAFGSTGACLEEDVNSDEVVDDADLLTVLFEFGTGC